MLPVIQTAPAISAAAANDGRRRRTGGSASICRRMTTPHTPIVISAIRVAAAAPTMPKRGMSTKFSATFTAAAAPWIFAWSRVR